MAASVDLYVRTARPSPALSRLRLLSRPFEVGFGALAMLAVASLVGFVAGGLVPNPILRMDPEGSYLVLDGVRAGTVAITDLPLSTRAVGLAVLLVLWGSLIVALVSLSRLFAGYRRGEVFTDASVRSMRHAAMAFVVFGLAPALTQPVLRLAGSLDRAWFHGHSVAAIIAGAALFVFAAVFSLGQEIAREAEGYV